MSEQRYDTIEKFIISIILLLVVSLVLFISIPLLIRGMQVIADFWQI